MTTDKTRAENRDDEQTDDENSAPDNLGFAAASTEEDYTKNKLTPDPGSDIGAVPPIHSTVEELPDTAERPGGPDITLTFEQEISAKGEDETAPSGVVQKEQRTTNPQPADHGSGETKPRGVTDPQT